MTPGLQSMVAVTYVRDIATSRAFYELLGFREESTGTGPASGWADLHHNGHSVLLASTQPPLEIPPLPLLFYFFVDDVDALVGAIRAAGTPADHVGSAAKSSSRTRTATPSCSARPSAWNPRRPPASRTPRISRS
jgi:hypothetical protein